jgi:hypothetical protein
VADIAPGHGLEGHALRDVALFFLRLCFTAFGGLHRAGLLGRKNHSFTCNYNDLN